MPSLVRGTAPRLPLVLAVLWLAGCPAEPTRPDGGERDGGTRDTGVPLDAPRIDGGPIDAPDLRAELFAALGSSVWSATLTRHEPDHQPTPPAPTLLDGGSPDAGPDARNFVERAYELRFDATNLVWTELRNPYGPARRRRFRVFVVDGDGRSVSSSIVTPEGWPDDPADGRGERWTFEIVDGTPRELHITNAIGEEEVFVEGPIAAPTAGLTAEVRTFAEGGAMDVAGCTTPAITSAERLAILEFARGASTEVAAATDVAAGVAIDRIAMASTTPISDLDGFDRLGGTTIAVDAQSRFVVRWTGTVTHAGGNLRLTEADDDVGTGLLAFLGASVGGVTLPGDVFLEVQSSSSGDLTGDTAQQNLAAGAIPFELVVWRCGGGADVDVEIDLGTGLRSIGADVATPAIEATLFPPTM